MAQEYTVRQWTPWENEDGPIRDKYGNYKGSILFDEDHGEPIDATFKQHPAVGDKKYGSVEPYTTQMGKKRTKFVRADKPQEEQQRSTTSYTYTPRDDAAIQAQWAIGQAVNWVSIQGGQWGKVEPVARDFYAMINRVKNSTSETTADDEYNIPTDEDFERR